MLRLVAIDLMMEAASTYENPVNVYQIIQDNNPEDSHIHTWSRESLKSQLLVKYTLSGRCGY
jgi:hypothetical protein